MSQAHILLPSKLKVVSEKETSGVYEIEGLYPGYGHTLGNSLRRIILSSLQGAAITKVAIDGVAHEFSPIEGVKEDAIAVLLNLKRVRFQSTSDEPQTATLTVKSGVVTAKDFKTPGQLTVLNPDQYICEVTGKKAVTIEVTVERGMGFVPRDHIRKEKNDIGVIAVDAIFTPIRKVNYEVENMRVGERTDHNRLRMAIETDGTLSPKEALESALNIMIQQLHAVLDLHYQAYQPNHHEVSEAEHTVRESGASEKSVDLTDVLKTRIDALDLSTRTLNALSEANIRTIGGLIQKTEEYLLGLEGFGQKSLEEIKEVLSTFGLSLK